MLAWRWIARATEATVRHKPPFITAKRALPVRTRIILIVTSVFVLLALGIGVFWWATWPADDADMGPVLTQSWASYKQRFIIEGRVIDPKQNNITTSEGQSYAMLRAVWMNDRPTFDAVWNWTQVNLRVRDDGLPAWRWGTKSDGTTGVLDNNAATDADQDIALALLFAARRWNEPAYQQEALELLRGIWEWQTAVIAGQRVLVAGNWARGSADEAAVVNPSYLAPYAYRIFAAADPERPWMELVDSSYALLAQIRADPRFGGAVGLAPNWLALDVASGALRPASNFGPYADEFSFDASRLPWRLALDWRWFSDPRAQQALEGLHFLPDTFAREGRLMGIYRVDGTPVVTYETISMYGGGIGGLVLEKDRALIERMYQEHLMRAYRNDTQGSYWGEPDNYYDQNWAWFGTALAENRLVNLWERRPWFGLF